MEDFAGLRDYPLGTKRPDLVRTPSGVPLQSLTLEQLRLGELNKHDLRATAETLRMQAAIAREAGRVPLARNLERAAELTAVPDEVILDVYTALRPGRSTAAELERLAQRLSDTYEAPLTAAFINQAIEAYRQRGLVL